jgi:predicted secreted protein
VANYELGNDIMVSLGGEVIGGQKDCSLNRESATADVTTKESGMWSEEEITGLSWSVDLSGFVTTDYEKIDKLQEAWRNAEQVDVKYGKPGRYEQGKAIITSLSTNSAAKDKTTYSLSLKGYGPLTMPGEGEE